MGMQICDHDTTVNVSSRSSVQKRHFFWMHDGVVLCPRWDQKSPIHDGSSGHDAVGSWHFWVSESKFWQFECGIHVTVLGMIEPLHCNEMVAVPVPEETAALGEVQGVTSVFFHDHFYVIVSWPPVEHLHGSECDEFSSELIGLGHLGVRDRHFHACSERHGGDPGQGFPPGFCLAGNRPRDGKESRFAREQFACPFSFFSRVAKGLPCPGVLKPDRGLLSNQGGCKQNRGGGCPRRGGA